MAARFPNHETANVMPTNGNYVASKMELEMDFWASGTTIVQVIFHTVRQCVRSVQGFESNERLSVDGFGLALMEAP